VIALQVARLGACCCANSKGLTLVSEIIAVRSCSAVPVAPDHGCYEQLRIGYSCGGTRSTWRGCSLACALHQGTVAPALRHAPGNGCARASDRVGVAFSGGRGHEHNERRNKHRQPRRHITRGTQCSNRIKLETRRRLLLRRAGWEVRRQCSTEASEAAHPAAGASLLRRVGQP
jgi:hypothetical protein